MEPFDKKRKNDMVGEYAKHPKMMLKVIFYAFSYGIYSMRQISSNYLLYSIDFIYLAAYKKADHSTFSRFINLYMEEITEIFLKVLFAARSMGFVNGNLIAIDGCKIKANASKSLSGNYDKFKRKKKLYEKMIKNLLERAARMDDKKKELPHNTKKEIDRGNSKSTFNVKLNFKIQHKIHTIGLFELRDTKLFEQGLDNIKRLEKDYNNKLTKIDKMLELYEKDEQKKNNKKQVNLTDPDSAIMMKENKAFQGYNCQAMVDNNGIIAANEIVNNCSDRDQALPMVHATTKTLRAIGMSEEKIKSFCFLMDKGYNDSSSLGSLMNEDYNIYVPFYRYEADLETAKLIKNHHCKLSKENGICKLECPGGQIMNGTRVNSTKAETIYKFFAGKESCLKCKFADKCFNKTKKRKTFTVSTAIFDNLENLNELRKKMDNQNELDIYHK